MRCSQPSSAEAEEKPWRRGENSTPLFLYTRNQAIATLRTVFCLVEPRVLAVVSEKTGKDPL